MSDWLDLIQMYIFWSTICVKMSTVREWSKSTGGGGGGLEDLKKGLLKQNMTHPRTSA